MHLKRNLNFFISKLLCSLEVGKAGKCMRGKGFSKQFSGWIRDLAGPVLAPRPCVWRLRIKFRGGVVHPVGLCGCLVGFARLQCFWSSCVSGWYQGKGPAAVPTNPRSLFTHTWFLTHAFWNTCFIMLKYDTLGYHRISKPKLPTSCASHC